MKKEVYAKKLDENGNPLIVDGDFVMELIDESDIIEPKLSNEEINRMQYEELKQTDWYFTRKIELGTEVPIDVINERLFIREKYDELKQNIAN